MATTNKEIIKFDLKEKHILIFTSFCIIGPELPYQSLIKSAMAVSPDGRGVLLFGGLDHSVESFDTILELRCVHGTF